MRRVITAAGLQVHIRPGEDVDQVQETGRKGGIDEDENQETTGKIREPEGDQRDEEIGGEEAQADAISQIEVEGKPASRGVHDLVLPNCARERARPGHENFIQRWVLLRDDAPAQHSRIGF